MDIDGLCDTKKLVSELCHHFYGLGWVSGTGGSMTIKVNNDKISKSRQLIVVSPSGVQKERMKAEDMYVLSSDGIILSSPPNKLYPHNPPKCSECAPIFLKVYEMRNAGAVIHSHGIESCLVTMIHPSKKEFRITHMEMIKGIQGHGYHDDLVIPIIENTAREWELVESLTEAIRSYPKSTAVLVRNHGVYIWGETWISTKTQAECYHYLFDAALKLYQLGLDWSTPDHGPIANATNFCGYCGNFPRGWKIRSLGSDNPMDLPQRYILLGIEGTTTPTSFVSHFFYTNFKENSLKNLAASSHRTDNDHYVTLLPSLSSNTEGMVFEDVPNALKKWHALGIKVYAFSCYKKELQHLLFGNSNYGDLRKYLCGYFDSTLGSTIAKETYKEISLTVGVKNCDDMLFVTSNLEEAFAARSAGLEVITTNRVRSGYETFPPSHGFRVIQSLLEI